MPTCGVGQKVALVRRDDGEVEGRVSFADCLNKDYIAVDAGGGRVVIELFVDWVTSGRRCNVRCRNRGSQGQSARPGMHGGAKTVKSGRQLARFRQKKRREKIKDRGSNVGDGQL